MKRISASQCVLIAAIVLVGLVATPVWAGNETVGVPAPNGTDDTAVLQAALDQCVALGPSCTVQLAAGRYLTRQLVVYDFRGELRGRGKEQTVIEALPSLHVDFLRLVVDGLPVLWAPGPEHPWPSLILFVDGDIRISDLSIQIPSVPSTEPYETGFGFPFSVLIDAVRFMGQHQTNATVHRVAIEGREDPGDTGFWGFNVANGISYLGELPTGTDVPFDYYRITGHLKVTASSVRRAASGVYPGVVKNARVTIGGSPSDGNVFENVAIGTDLESLESSVVEVSHNSVRATSAAAWAIPWCCGYLPQKPSLFSIHHNTLKPTGEFADGVVLVDDLARPWIHAQVFDNAIEAQDIGYGAISAYNTRGTSIRNNRVSGRGADGIGLWNSTRGVVLANDVEDFTADSAQIVLDGTTSRTTVLCETAADTVLNQGPDNKIIGCQEVDAP